MICFPFLSLGCCCMLYGASVHFIAAACATIVGEGVGIVVPLMITVPFDVGKEDGPGEADVGVEELDRTGKLWMFELTDHKFCATMAV